MSIKLTYDGSHSWNYIGKFYGIRPEVLAAYNGEAGAKLDAKIAKGTTVSIPNARDLVAFFPSYYGKLLLQGPPTSAAMRSPTLLGNQGFRLRAPTVAGDAQLIQPASASPIVIAGRMRRFSHTGDNYTVGNPLRSPNLSLTDNGSVPDAKAIHSLAPYYKCNVMVGDSIYAAGYSWPLSKNGLYLQPRSLYDYMLKPNPFADPVWSTPWATPTHPSEADLKKAAPGDVVLLHNQAGKEGPHHSAILVAGPARDQHGALTIRLLDIYGEYWAEVDQENIVAILRPKAKLATAAASTIGGNVMQAKDVLDGSEDVDDNAVVD